MEEQQRTASYSDSPKPDDEVFTRYYETFVDDVIRRDNFKKGHLEQLSILCQMYVEFERLTKVINDEGYTYFAETRNGLQQKVNVNVLIRDKVVAEIRHYSKMLGIVLDKDKETVVEDSGLDDWL